jgi:hypothetical protein
MGIKVRLVEGTPLTIGQKKLTLVMRAISWGGRRAAVHRDSVNGFGFGAAWLQPVAVLEETADGVRHIPIRDETDRAMLRLLAIAVAVTLVVSLLTWLFRAKD